MIKLEKYKERFSRSLEEGVTQAQKSGSFKRSADNLFYTKSKFGKLQAAIGLISELLPESALARAKERYAYDFGSLSVSDRKFSVNPEKIAVGGEDKVFLLESKSDDAKSYVLKINYIIKGNAESVATAARGQKEEYEKIEKRYRDIPDLIPHELNFVTVDPRNNQPCIITIQEFFGANLTNVVDQGNKKQIVKMLKEDKNLLQNMINFVRITLEAANKERQIADIGNADNSNLVFADTENGRKLILLDSHNPFSFPSGSVRTNKNNMQRLNCLVEICKEASENKREMI